VVNYKQRCERVQSEKMELLKKNIKNYQEHFEKLEQKLSKARLVPNWRKTQRKTAEKLQYVPSPTLIFFWFECGIWKYTILKTIVLQPS
jgi:seryl-tRNA(Sec) selenium transferase